MPSLTLTKDIEGRLCGLTERDHAAYMRFMDRAIALTQDESILFTWKDPRSPDYHKRHFAMLNTIFKAQETFVDDEVFRKWAEMEAGYCEQVPGRDGVMKVPKSVAYDKLDQFEFEAVHAAVFGFLRTQHALMVLWPHMTYQQAYNMMDALLRDHDRPMTERR